MSTGRRASAAAKAEAADILLDLLFITSHTRSWAQVFVVTTYNQSRDHGEQRLGSYLNALKSEHLCATSLDRDTSVDLGGPETVPGTFLASSDDLGDSAILHGRS